jgi:hypothetical protein
VTANETARRKMARLAAREESVFMGGKLVKVTAVD